MTAEEWFGVGFIILIVCMLTNFFGLGDVWANRGSWYVVYADQLETVMKNLSIMGAFMNEDGIPYNCIKIKAYRTAIHDPVVYYTVKVPNYVFKYIKYQDTQAKRRELLGLTES